ncbi:MAG TPA: GyrI-like domain-containing protein [Acidothermaceae bacterium]|jgi:effector-binding domain-containing protein|nr:GyrI-like domain-containing protein [Acidothermaceae bacterium]
MPNEEPRIETREFQPYAAIKAFVTMEELDTVPPSLHPQVRDWLAQRGVTPSGPPFVKYNVIDMERQLEIEVGWPIPALLDADERVLVGELPSGRYVVTVHHGHPDGLIDAVRALLNWADEQGLIWDVTEVAKGDQWGCRLEIYLTDSPDMDTWDLELVFRLADPF